MTTNLKGENVCSTDGWEITLASGLGSIHGKGHVFHRGTHPALSARLMLGILFPCPARVCTVRAPPPGSAPPPALPRSSSGLCVPQSVLYHLPPSRPFCSSRSPRVIFLKYNKLPENPPCCPVTFWVEFKLLICHARYFVTAHLPASYLPASSLCTFLNILPPLPLCFSGMFSLLPLAWPIPTHSQSSTQTPSPRRLSHTHSHTPKIPIGWVPSVIAQCRTKVILVVRSVRCNAFLPTSLLDNGLLLTRHQILWVLISGTHLSSNGFLCKVINFILNTNSVSTCLSLLWLWCTLLKK